MGAIIRMDSKKLINKFIKEVDPKDYQYVLVSEFITTRNEFKNVKAIPRLMPPPSALGEFADGNEKGYKKAYLKYLQQPNIDSLVGIIVKAALVNDMKMVLLCSKSEDEFKYLQYLCEYIEAVYKMKTYTSKEFLKDPEKLNKIKNKNEVAKVIDKKFDVMQKSGMDLDTENNKEKYIKEVKKLGRKGMKKLAKSKNIKLKDDMSKDDMAKKIVKKLLA